MRRVAVLIATLALVAVGCGGDDDSVAGSSLTVYSGRGEELVGPLIEQFEEETGIDVDVRYAGSSELAATLLEEGDRSPADVFYAQDPASLGSVALAGMLAELPAQILERVPAEFSDRDGRWVGVSGRARVVVYDTTKIDAADIPETEDGFTDPAWSGRVAVAPTNGSFLSFVAAKILLDGEEATMAWLEGMASNGAPTFDGNSAIVAAVDEGQIDAGLVNHYYLLRRKAEMSDVVAENHFLAVATAGSLVMPSGAGILSTSEKRDAAEAFVEFLLTAESQEYFRSETFEYPLTPGIAGPEGVPPIDEVAAPDVDLSQLATLLDTASDLVARAGLL